MGLAGGARPESGRGLGPPTFLDPFPTVLPSKPRVSEPRMSSEPTPTSTEPRPPSRDDLERPELPADPGRSAARLAIAASWLGILAIALAVAWPATPSDEPAAASDAPPAISMVDELGGGSRSLCARRSSRRTGWR